MWQKLAAGAGLLALAAFFGWLYGTARYQAGELAERGKWLQQQVRAERSAGERIATAERRAGQAYAAFAERLAQREPIIIRSRDTVTRYAETVDGARRCLGAERLLGIDALDRELFLLPTPPTIGSDGALPAVAEPSPAGRDSNSRGRGSVDPGRSVRPEVLRR